MPSQGLSDQEVELPSPALAGDGSSLVPPETHLAHLAPLPSWINSLPVLCPLGSHSQSETPLLSERNPGRLQSKLIPSKLFSLLHIPV